MRQKRKKTRGGVRAALLVLLAGCAVLAALHGADVGPVREWTSRLLTSDKPPEQAESALPNDAETEGAEIRTPSASGAAGTKADPAPPIEDGMPLAEAVAPAGAAGAIAEGAAYRIDLSEGGMFSYKLWRGHIGTAAVRNDTVLASLIFESALRAGLEAGERHIHDALPEGVRAGFDADVSDGRDLTLRNPHPFPVVLLITASDGKLVAEWIGDAPADWTAPAVSVSEPQTFRPERIELISADPTRTGETSGKPGMLVKVYVDGRLAHHDFYAPVPARTVRAAVGEERAAFVHDGSLDGS